MQWVKAVEAISSLISNKADNPGDEIVSRSGSTPSARNDKVDYLYRIPTNHHVIAKQGQCNGQQRLKQSLR